MMRDRRSVPTVYRCVQFRSRLEARWAAMFDLLGWEWAYEPFDLEGWIPDFALTTFAPTPATILVEVKPAVEPPDSAIRKILATSWSGPFLVVGWRMFDTGSDSTAFGWLYERDEAGGGWTSDEAAFCGPPGLVGLSATTLLWSDRLGRCGDGKQIWDGRTPGHIRRLWAEAGNLVQWRGVRSVVS